MPLTYRELYTSLSPVYGDGEARAIVRLVLETRFGMPYADIVCGGPQALDEEAQKELEAIMRQLRQGRPVQYVLGEAEFCGRMFAVREGVLIPRPETAEMTMDIAEEFSGVENPIRILDVCTGSGCIAVTLAAELPQAEVEAWDISNVALSVARDNAGRFGVKVNVVSQDALLPPDDTMKWTVIVSNPPYVMDRERMAMEPHVLDYEPSLALFVPDTDPLRFYTAISRYAVKALAKGGLLYFEINPLCASGIVRMLDEMGFIAVEVIGDLFGKQRFVKAYRP